MHEPSRRSIEKTLRSSAETTPCPSARSLSTSSIVSPSNAMRPAFQGLPDRPNAKTDHESATRTSCAGAESVTTRVGLGLISADARPAPSLVVSKASRSRLKSVIVIGDPESGEKLVEMSRPRTNLASRGPRCVRARARTHPRASPPAARPQNTPPNAPPGAEAPRCSTPETSRYTFGLAPWSRPPSRRSPTRARDSRPLLRAHPQRLGPRAD